MDNFFERQRLFPFPISKVSRGSDALSHRRRKFMGLQRLLEIGDDTIRLIVAKSKLIF